MYFGNQENKENVSFQKEVDIIDNLDDNEMVVYVDGSNLSDGSAFSWGIVAFSKELGRVNVNGRKDGGEFAKHRNVAGELFAAVKAIKFAIDNNVSKLIIYHDYSGIRHWALGEWKTKNKLSQSYKQFFNQISELITIEFIKVKGHAGDVFNEEADKLAKKALGLKT